MKKLDLRPILENAPKGLPLYSSYCGPCTFDCVSDKIWVKNNTDHLVGFNFDGTLSDTVGSECLLFPNLETRTWNNWQEVLFRPGDVVFCSVLLIVCRYGKVASSDGKKFYPDKKEALPFYRYATPEEKERFYKEVSEHHMIWSDVTQELIKGEPFKYEVGQPVLIDDTDTIYQVKDTYRDWEGNMYLVSNWGSNNEIRVHEDKIKLWDIRDARIGTIVSCALDDGDFSGIGHYLGIYSGIEDGFITMSCYYNLDKNVFTPDSAQMFCRVSESSSFKPALPDEVKRLADTMIKNGYGWDSEKNKVLWIKFKKYDRIFRKDDNNWMMHISEVTISEYKETSTGRTVKIKDQDNFEKLKFGINQKLRKIDEPKNIVCINDIKDGVYITYRKDEIPFSEQDKWVAIDDSGEVVIKFKNGDTIYKIDDPDQIMTIERHSLYQYFLKNGGAIPVNDQDKYSLLKFPIVGQEIVSSYGSLKIKKIIVNIDNGNYICSDGDKIPFSMQDNWDAVVEEKGTGADINEVPELFGNDDYIEGLVSNFKEENFGDKENEFIDFIVKIYRRGAEDAVNKKNGVIMRSLTPEDIAKFNEMLPEWEPLHNLIVEEKDDDVLGE